MAQKGGYAYPSGHLQYNLSLPIRMIPQKSARFSKNITVKLLELVQANVFLRNFTLRSLLTSTAWMMDEYGSRLKSYQDQLAFTDKKHLAIGIEILRITDLEHVVSHVLPMVSMLI